MDRYKQLLENEDKVLSDIRSFIRENKYFISEKDKKPAVKQKGSKSKVQQKSVAQPKITKTPTKNQAQAADEVISQWDLMAKNPAVKTKVFETVPLLYALKGGKSADVKYSEIKDLITKGYDWDEKGKKWLEEMFEIIGKSDSPYGLRKSFRENIIYKKILTPDGQSISDINGGKAITDFIHGKIGDFYKVLDQDERSKVFTADAVVFWGGQKGVADKVLSGEIPMSSFVPNEKNSTLTSKKYGVTMACISLKALHGKLGKIKKFVVNHYDDGSSKMSFDDNEDESTNESLELNENIFSTMKDMVTKSIDWISNTKVAKKIVELYKGFKKWATETYNNIMQIISPSAPEVIEGEAEFNKMKKQAEDLLAEFDNQMNEYMKLNGLTEVSEEKPIPITDCYAQKIEVWYSSFKKNMENYNKRFIEFGKIAQQYKNDPFLRIEVQTLNTSLNSFIEWKSKVNTFVTTELEEAKKHPGELVKPNSKTSKCRYLLYGNKNFEKSRAEMKPILMSAANFQSLSTLSAIIKRYSGVSSKQETAKALENIVKIATEFNAEAIYGGAFDIPLIKYDGSKILRLGSRTKYEEKATDDLVTKIQNINTKLPVIGIVVYPSQAKSADDIIPTWYQVVSYTLAEYVENIEKGVEDTRSIEEKLLYNAIMFSCNSGSEFSYSIEGTDRITGKAVLEKLSKNSPDWNLNKK